MQTKRRLHIPLLAAVLALWIAGILALDPFGLAGCPEPQRHERRGTFRIEVCDVGRAAARSVAYRVTDRTTGDDYLLHWAGQEEFLPGDVVEVSGIRFAAPDTLSAYDLSLLRRGMRGRIYARRLLATVDGEEPSALHAMRRQACLVRRRLEARLRRAGLSEPSVAVACGILFGDASGLDDAARTDIRGAGMSHLMAVSGLHVGLLFALVLCVLWPLRWVGCSAATRLTALAAAWAYVVLVGCPPSAVRAAVMLSAVVVAWLRHSGTWGWHNLCLAAFLILVYDPQQLYDVGFQLSFLATAGILAFAPAWRRAPEVTPSPWAAKGAIHPSVAPLPAHGLRLRRAAVAVASVARAVWTAVRRFVLLAFSAQVFTLPVVAYVFHQVPLLGWVQGVAVAPAMAVYVAALLWLLAFPSAAWGAGAVAEVCARWMLSVAHAVRMAEEWLLGGRIYWYPSALEAALMMAGLVACVVAWRARLPWLWMVALGGWALWLCVGFVGG